MLKKQIEIIQYIQYNRFDKLKSKYLVYEDLVNNY